MSSDINWEDQRAFLAVVEEGSLSAAARRLGVAQPTIRARITALEQAIGVVLFTRSVNGLAPTAYAHALTESVRTMAKASDAFVRSASGTPGELAGTVRLSVAEFVGIEVMPAMLARLKLTHPGIVVELSLSNIAADILEQEVDIAVRMHPPQQKALIARKVGTIALGLFAHHDYLDRRGVPASLDELASHDMIGPDRSRADLEIAGELMPGLRREKFSIRTDSHPAQLALARAGMGMAVCHRAIGLADPRLRQLLPDTAFPSIDTWIVMHEDLRSVPRIRAVFDHLCAEFETYSRDGQRRT